MRTRVGCRVWLALVVSSGLAACATSASDQRDSVPVVSRPSARRVGDSASQRFELRTLQGEPLPVTLAQVRNDTQEECGDTTYAGAYELRGSRWINHEVTGNDCSLPAQHHEQTDSGRFERWRDSVRFLYPSGGAVTGWLSADSLVIEDGGPREVYRRVHE